MNSVFFLGKNFAPLRLCVRFLSREGAEAQSRQSSNSKLYIIPVLLIFLSFDKPAASHHTRAVLPKIDNIPFQPGEKLTFNLHYGIINAGTAYLEVNKKETEIAGQKHFEIDVNGNSNSFFDPFYKVRDNYKSFIDESTMLPSLFIRDVHEGSYSKKENYIFVRRKNEVVSGKRIYSVPEGVHDLVSTFYYLRCIDFSKQKIGAVMHITALFDDSLLNTGLVYSGKETISTKFGKIRCYVFHPILVKGRIFKNQEGMILYVSEDKNQIPVRIESKVYLDYVRADLEKYENLKYPLEALEKK